MTTDGTELMVIPPPPLTVFGTDDPRAIMERVADVAGPLADFIKRQKMALRIGDRDYVRVEGWSFMGAMLGVSPRVVSVLAAARRRSRRGLRLRGQCGAARRATARASAGPSPSARATRRTGTRAMTTRSSRWRRPARSARRTGSRSASLCTPQATRRRLPRRWCRRSRGRPSRASRCVGRHRGPNRCGRRCRSTSCCSIDLSAYPRLRADEPEHPRLAGYEPRRGRGQAGGGSRAVPRRGCGGSGG